MLKFLKLLRDDTNKIHTYTWYLLRVSSYLLLNQPHWYKKNTIISLSSGFNALNFYPSQVPSASTFSSGRLSDQYFGVHISWPFKLSTLPETKSSRQKMEGWKTIVLPIQKGPKNKAILRIVIDTNGWILMERSASNHSGWSRFRFFIGEDFMGIFGFLGQPGLFFQLLHFALVLPHDLHCVLGETPRRSGDPLDLLPLARMLARTPARMTWHPWKIGNPELNLHVWLLLGGGVRPKKSPSYNLPRAPETNSQFTSLALKFWCLVRMKSPFRARPSSGSIAVSFRKCICWVLQKNTVTVDSIKVKNRDSLHTNEWID